MKRRFFAILLVMGLLCSLVVVHADACAHENCAYAYDDEKYDIYRCLDCGETLWYDDHYRYCGDPAGICIKCACTMQEDTVYHRGWELRDQGNGTHAYTCKACGIMDEPVPHKRYCDGPEGVCAECDAIWDGEMTIDHLQDEAYPLNETMHGYRCSACGVDTWEPEEHVRRCDDPEDICRLCGSAAKDPGVAHLWFSYQDVGDGTHMMACTLCGTTDPTTQEKHRALCYEDPNVCFLCGAPCDNAVHSYMTFFNLWDGAHKSTCQKCGQVLVELHNWDWGVVVKAATDTEEGVRLFKCQRCKATKKEAIPALAPEKLLPYLVEEVVIDGGHVTGKLVLQEGETALESVFVRMEMQLADGNDGILVMPLDDTLAFDVTVEGSITHLIIEVTDTDDVVEDGDWTVYGRYETK